MDRPPGRGRLRDHPQRRFGGVHEPLGLATATAVLVGRAYGRRDEAGMRRAAYTGFAVAAAFGVVVTIVVAIFAGPVARLYTGDAAALALTSPALAFCTCCSSRRTPCRSSWPGAPCPRRCLAAHLPASDQLHPDHDANGLCPGLQTGRPGPDGPDLGDQRLGRVFGELARFWYLSRR